MKLSDTEIEAIQEEMAQYEDSGAACIDALKIVQSHRGWISDEALQATAEVVGVTPTQMEAVATFYNLIFRQPVGRHVIMICDSISCWLSGYEEISAYLKKKLGVEFGETTPDDRFTLLPIVCLGDCDNGPSMRINEDYHGKLTPERVDTILEDYE